MTSDRADCCIMISLAHRRTGRGSVGLNAVALGGIGDPAAARPVRPVDLPVPQAEHEYVLHPDGRPPAQQHRGRDPLDGN
jgi:hypothetical protein